MVLNKTFFLFLNKCKYFFGKSECTRTPNTLILKQLYGCLKEAENHDCSLWAGFCSCILSSIRHLAPLVLFFTMTHAAGIRTWEQAAFKWQFCEPSQQPQVKVLTWASPKAGLPCRQHLAIAVLIFLPCGAAAWMHLVLIAACCRLWHILSDSRSKEIIES